MKTDDICRKFSGKKFDLTVKLLKDGDSQLILIKGGEGALKFLASLITAVADEVENDGFSISPTGAGANYFSKMSTMGIYIYRKPKDRGPGRIKSGEKSKKSVRVTRTP